MRISLVVVVGFAFVLGPGMGASAQEVDLNVKRDASLIDDLTPARKAGKNVKQRGESPSAVAAKKLPATLSEALTKALLSNPDLLLSEAELQQAQAQFRQAQLRAVQEVTVTFRQRESQQRELESRERSPGAASRSELLRLKQTLAETDAKLAYLLGIGAEAPFPESADAAQAGSRTPQLGTYAPAAPAAKRPEIPEKLHELLRQPINLGRDLQLHEVFEVLREKIDNKVRIVVSANAPSLAGFIEAGEEAPLLAILEMVADMTGGAFMVRDYGLLFVPREDARQYPGAVIPADLPPAPSSAGAGFF